MPVSNDHVVAVAGRGPRRSLAHRVELASGRDSGSSPGYATRVGRIVLTILVALPVFAVAGCGTQLPPSATDACNAHASWVSAGSPRDDAERLARGLAAAIADESSDPVSPAVAAFVDAVDTGKPIAIREASEQLTDTCGGAGWIPAEG
jgi:hypothetical protein